jgi:ADP-ribosylation factor GTPase-activating protein 1
LGVDVAGQVGTVVDTVKERVVGAGHEGYGALATRPDGDGWDDGRYQDEDDFFGEFEGERKGQTSAGATSSGTLTSSGSGTTTNSASATSSATATNATKKNDSWDEWADF